MANNVGRAYTARGPVEGEDWTAVARTLNERMAARRIGQQDLATASGVSVSTLRQLQHGVTGRRVQNKTLAAVARALDWPDDHLIRLLLNDAPTPDVPPSESEQVRAELDDIRAELHRVVQRLDDLERRPSPVR